MPTAENRPDNLRDLRASGWVSKTVKQEMRDNFLRMLQAGEELYPGIIGYENTVIPEINLALIAGHDLLFLGEKGQAKSRLMRSLARFLDDAIPYMDHPACPVHEDPYKPISSAGKRLAELPEDQVPIGWWPRDQRYAERLAPGTKFADVIGEIDPAKLAAGASMATEDALHFGLIPRMHRGIFAMNEVPELDELVQVGLFNILEERDVQIRGYPIQFDLDVLILFSANPATYNRSGKVIPQLKDRVGALVQTHYPLERAAGIDIMEQEANIELGGEFPVLVPLFMKEIIEQISISARKSKYVDHASGVSARFSIANYRTIVAAPRHRGVRLKEKPAVPHQRPGPSLRLLARQARAGHDGQPANVGTSGDRSHHGRGDRQGVRGICRKERSGRNRPDLRQGREDRSRRHAAVRPVRGQAQARAQGLGKSVRGQPERERSRARLLHRIHPGGPLRHRPRFPLPETRPDYLRNPVKNKKRIATEVTENTEAEIPISS